MVYSGHSSPARVYFGSVAIGNDRRLSEVVENRLLWCGCFIQWQGIPTTYSPLMTTVGYYHDDDYLSFCLPTFEVGETTPLFWDYLKRQNALPLRKVNQLHCVLHFLLI